MARSDEAQLPARVHGLAADAADPLDVEILDVKVKGQRGRRLVRVTADRIDPAADLYVDTIARLSRRLGDLLDEQDVIAGAYTLEVTSPGADRPLTRVRDFQRNVGRDVRIVRAADREGPPEVTGTLVAVDDDEVTLEIDGGPVTVSLDDVDHGRVVLPW
jgi:ribosome maturation factor RimP